MRRKVSKKLRQVAIKICQTLDRPMDVEMHYKNLKRRYKTNKGKV